MFDVELVWDLGPFDRRMLAAPAKIISALKKAVMAAETDIKEYIRREKLSGQVLYARKGHLRRAITVLPVTEEAGVIQGVMGIGQEAWYGKVHEYGGDFTAVRQIKLPPHLAKRKSGERVMTGTPYTIHFPERSFWRTGFREEGPRAKEILMKGFEKALANV